MQSNAHTHTCNHTHNKQAHKHTRTRTCAHTHVHAHTLTSCPAGRPAAPAPAPGPGPGAVLQGPRERGCGQAHSSCPEAARGPAGEALLCWEGLVPVGASGCVTCGCCV